VSEQQWYPGDVGQQAPTGTGLAAWWKRLVALVVDNALLYAVSALVAIQGTSSTTVSDLRLLTELVLTFLYFGYLNGVHGQTVGKRLLGIRVVDVDTGEPVGLARGLARYGVVALLSMALVVPEIIDGLWPLRDPRRQSWHDKVARTLVVNAR